MRTFLRCLGWLFAALAASFLTRDLYQLVDQGVFNPLSTGFVWFTLHPTSLQLAEAGILPPCQPVPVAPGDLDDPDLAGLRGDRGAGGAVLPRRPTTGTPASSVALGGIF